MKKLITFVIASLVSFSVFAGEAIYNRDRPNEVRGWTVSVIDEDIDSTLELITQLATTYKQMSTPDSIELYSGSASDITQSISISGINNANGKKVTEVMSLTGTDVASSDTVFRYLDQVESNAICLGVVSLRDQDNNTLITSIPIGRLEAGMVQHFNGEKDSYITGWKASKGASNNTLVFDLRFYPDDARSTADTLGMVTRDTLFIEAGEGTAESIFSQPIRLKAGGFVGVYGKSDTNNVKGSVTLFGYDVQP